MKSKGEIILYKTPEGDTQLDVKIEDETVWLTQAQLTQLFQSTKQNISLHINSIFKEKELDRKSTVRKCLTVQTEGKRKILKKQLSNCKFN